MSARRVLAAERAWPGTRGYVEPKAVPAEPERLRDRLALVIVALPELDAISERLGLAGWLVVRGALVYAGGIVHVNALREHDPDGHAALEEWCARHRVATVLGPRRHSTPRISSSDAVGFGSTRRAPVDLAMTGILIRSAS